MSVSINYSKYRMSKTVELLMIFNNTLNLLFEFYRIIQIF